MNGFRNRQLIALLASLTAVIGLLALAGSAGADPIDTKREQARQAKEQIEQMDMELEKVIERYNSAVYHLDQTEARLDRTRTELKIARTSLGRARHALNKRVISVYMDQGDASNSTVAILFQANSLEDMVERIEAAERISDHDAQVVRQVADISKKVTARKVSLEKMQARQRSLVARISSEKSSVERRIAERKAFVRSVSEEIASLVAEERRQAQLQAQRARRIVAGYSSEPVSVEAAPIGAAPPSSIGAAVVQAAMTRLGMPYVWAAAGPDSFDCSGLVMWAFAQAGMSLPHSSYAQMGGGVPVAYSDLQAGDLVFFNGGSHVGIYVGGGSFVHAPHTGAVVSVSSLGGHGGFTAARRYGT